MKTNTNKNIIIKVLKNRIKMKKELHDMYYEKDEKMANMFYNEYQDLKELKRKIYFDEKIAIYDLLLIQVILQREIEINSVANVTLELTKQVKKVIQNIKLNSALLEILNMIEGQKQSI